MKGERISRCRRFYSREKAGYLAVLREPEHLEIIEVSGGSTASTVLFRPQKGVGNTNQQQPTRRGRQGPIVDGRSFSPQAWEPHVDQGDQALGGALKDGAKPRFEAGAQYKQCEPVEEYKPPSSRQLPTRGVRLLYLGSVFPTPPSRVPDSPRHTLIFLPECDKMTCYVLDGSVDDLLWPCDNSTDAHSTCCPVGTTCWSNGVCMYEPEDGPTDYLRAGCTDPTWDDSACLKQCEECKACPPPALYRCVPGESSGMANTHIFPTVQSVRKG